MYPRVKNIISTPKFMHLYPLHQSLLEKKIIIQINLISLHFLSLFYLKIVGVRGAV